MVKKWTGFTTAEEVLAGKKNVKTFLNEEVATKMAPNSLKSGRHLLSKMAN